MMIRLTVLMCSTMFALPLTATAKTPAPAADGVADASVAKGPGLRKTLMLRDLDAEMLRSGKVAVPDVHGPGGRIVMAASTSQRAEAKVDTVSAASPQKVATWLLLRDDPTLSVQYGDAFTAAVGECRFKIAQQLGVSPVDILAGVVTFRWTIEPSGRVRGVSTVADSPTDEALMVCAQHVVIRRVLLNAVDKPLALEWTYAFRKLAPSTESP
jgi:hypothetical protein